MYFHIFSAKEKRNEIP